MLVPHTPEVLLLTLNQDLVQRGHLLVPDHLAAHSLVSIRHHLHTPDGAEARVEITAQRLDLMDIVDLGQGHHYIGDVLRDQGPLPHLGDSLQINGLYHKGKQDVHVLRDTEKFHHHMTEKLITAGALTLETPLRTSTTESGRENTESGMTNSTEVMLLEHSLEHQPTEIILLQKAFHHLISGILPLRGDAERFTRVDKVVEVETQVVATLQKSFQQETATMGRTVQSQKRRRATVLQGMVKEVSIRNIEGGRKRRLSKHRVVRTFWKIKRTYKSRDEIHPRGQKQNKTKQNQKNKNKKTAQTNKTSKQNTHKKSPPKTLLKKKTTQNKQTKKTNKK